MNNKIKTVLAVAGLVLSVNASASAQVFTDANGLVVAGNQNAAAQNIASIQTTLSNLGYFVGSYGATGVMNNTTRIAIKQFQADAGLKSDGVVGLQTAEMLNRFADGNTQWSANRYAAPVGYAPVNYAPVNYAPANYYGNQGYYVAPSAVQYRIQKPTAARTGVYW